MSDAPVFPVVFENGHLSFVGYPQYFAAPYMKTFVYQYKGHPAYEIIHESLLTGRLDPAMPWVELYHWLYEQPVQFATPYQPVRESLDLVLAQLPPNLIKDPDFLCDKFYLTLKHGSSNPHKALSRFLPPLEAWPRLASHCGSEYFDKVSSEDEDEDDFLVPDPTITFVQTVSHLNARLHNFVRMDQTSKFFPFVALHYNGYGEDRDLHRAFTGRLYSYERETWRKFSRTVVWGCKCSTTSYTDDMRINKGLPISPDPFDLALFENGPV